MIDNNIFLYHKSQFISSHKINLIQRTFVLHDNSLVEKVRDWLLGVPIVSVPLPLHLAKYLVIFHFFPSIFSTLKSTSRTFIFTHSAVEILVSKCFTTG
jgi:hypothetical protein